ncbi:MAG: matrixin family metalloprotease, partial [Planctomycetota bacterium]
MPKLRCSLLVLVLGTVAPFTPLLVARAHAALCACGGHHAGLCPHGFAAGGGDPTQPGAGGPAAAPFQLTGRWNSTSQGTFFGGGTPVTLTWGFVPDGLFISGGLGEPGSPSDLIAFLDANVGDGSDTTAANPTDQSGKSWFSLFQSAYDRWESISGLTFLYEPNDSGAFLNLSGQDGVRADLRISGHFIDGQGPAPDNLAYNYFPTFGDMVIDTSNVDLYSNSADNFLRLRNVLMHEIGHGLGLNHVESNNSRQLMEPRIDLAIEGPQIDDILGIQRHYGDALEKNGGNNTQATATFATSLSLFAGWAIGVDADFTDPGQPVRMDQTDFISIDDNGDVDFFEFVAADTGLLDLRAKPVGPTYNEAAQATGPQPLPQDPMAASEQSRLIFSVVNSQGQQIAFAQAASLGDAVVFNDLAVQAGESYFVRVGGSQNTVQLYRLDAALNPAAAPGIRFDLANLPAAGQREFSLTAGGVELTVGALGQQAALGAAGQGLGVLSADEREDPQTPLSEDLLSIDGSLATPEQLLLSFDTDVRIENLEIVGLEIGGDESVLLS